MTTTVPSNVLGWKVGETRSYKFFGCVVEAHCTDDDEVKLSFDFGDYYRRSSVSVCPSYENVENVAQEWCAEMILQGLQSGALRVEEEKL